MALQQSSDLVAGQRASLIGFVWRPQEITPAVMQMAQRTGSRAVFDFSMLGVDGLGSWLRIGGPCRPGQGYQDLRLDLP